MDLFRPSRIQPITPTATPETVALLRKLDDMGRRTNILIGTTAVIAAGPAAAATPEFYSNLQDFRAITGRNPSIVQWEYHDPLWTDRYGQAGTDLVRDRILQYAAAGSVIALNHHPGNPVTGALAGVGTSWPLSGSGSCYDKTADGITACLPGGSQRAQFTAYLDRLADFINSLQIGGVKIPVILRWWHEMAGGWSWWNTDRVGAINLWRDTVGYLRDIKGVASALYCSNYDYPNEQSGWYPGDAWVDIHSIDIYDNTATPTPESNGLLAAGYARLVADTNKPLLLGECGYSKWGAGDTSIWTKSIQLWATKYPRFAGAILWRTPWGVGMDSPSLGRTNFALAVADQRVI